LKSTRLLIQFVKYGVVGISNTLLTAAIIWIMMKVCHSSDYVSNIIGYIVGLINSFIWNRRWTFENNSQLSKTAFKFIITFAISYLLQLGNLYLLLNYTTFDAYFCQLTSIVVYTSVNFILNKYYTFKINNE